MKGMRVEEELRDSQDVLKNLSLEISKKVELRLPLHREKRSLIFLKKR
jgi:hypothetical protein